MIGLTSLLDALALGKAVIMTQYSHINIDIEKEGIGLWVMPGDVAGWRKAISYLLENPNETQEMGKRARLLCEQKYNLDLFSQEIARIINQTYTKFIANK
jgi:glycosyltransferase involved in cell wall biosynthesis